MGGHSKLHRPLALEDLLPPSYLPEGVYLLGRSGSLFGRSMLVSQSARAFTRKATLGGIIYIDHRAYGITVAHCFDADQFDPTSDDGSDFKFYGSGDPYATSDDSKEDSEEDTETGKVV